MNFHRFSDTISHNIYLKNKLIYKIKILITNKMKLNNMLEDHQTRLNVQKEDLKSKLSILLLLLITVIVVSVIIFNNYVDVQNQNNVHLDKK